MGSCWGHVLVPLPMTVTMGCMLERGGEWHILGMVAALESQRFPGNSQTICPLNCQPGGCSRAQGHPPSLSSLLAWTCRGSSALCHTPNPRMPSPRQPGAHQILEQQCQQAGHRLLVPLWVHRVCTNFSASLKFITIVSQGCPAAQGYSGIPHSPGLLGAAKRLCAPCYLLSLWAFTTSSFPKNRV